MEMSANRSWRRLDEECRDGSDTGPARSRWASTYMEFWLNPITYTLLSSKVSLASMKSSTA